MEKIFVTVTLLLVFACSVVGSSTKSANVSKENQLTIEDLGDTTIFQEFILLKDFVKELVQDFVTDLLQELLMPGKQFLKDFVGEILQESQLIKDFFSEMQQEKSLMKTFVKETLQDEGFIIYQEHDQGFLQRNTKRESINDGLCQRSTP